MSGKVIYTVLIGGYENLRNAPKFEGWDVIAFTDKVDVDNKGWKLIELPISDLGVVRTSRLPRILPYKYLSEYEESLYIDASIELKKSPDEWIPEGALWASCRHWERNNVWQEFLANRIAEKTHLETNLAQEKKYKDAGLESMNIPLFQNCVIYRKHNNQKVIDTCNAWWRNFCEGTCRDQLSFPMALGETGLQVTEILPRPKSSTDNDYWQIKHVGMHAKIYAKWGLNFIIYNMRGSAISRGIQAGKALFDRGVRNRVTMPSAIQEMKNCDVVVVKELREKDISKLKNQGCRIIYDIVDNVPIWKNGLGNCGKYIDSVIFPCPDLKNKWLEKGWLIGKKSAVIDHHFDSRFSANEATGFSPVCICTSTQIPKEVHSAGIDCITETNSWEGLFDNAKKYNLHIGVYADGVDYEHKPPSKLVTAVGCEANIILQKTPSNLRLLSDDYPYYVNGASDIPAALERCRNDYGTESWDKALDMIRAVKCKVTADAIANKYERFLMGFDIDSEELDRQPKSAVVVGAGLSGCVAARQLMDKGYSVTIYETADDVGGACMDNDNNQLYGYHIFHTNEKLAWDYLCRFTSFKNYVHSVMANTDMGLIPIPYNYHSETITGSLTDAEIQALIFDEYSRKQWGHTFSELPDEVRARVQLRREGTDIRYFTDTYQGVPSDGFCAMLKKMIDGCELKLGAEKDEWKNHNADIVIYTGSPDMIYNCDNGQLPYRSVTFETTDETLPAAVVNDCTANVPYTRKHDYRYIGGNLTQTETPCDYVMGENEPYYPVTNGVELANKYIERAHKDGIHCLGRLGRYKYINMDVAISDAIELVNDIICKKNKPKIQNKSTTTKENIHIFFHVAMMGRWKSVLAEQLQTLNESGLLDVCKSATAVCVGDAKDIPAMPDKFKVIYGGTITSYEFPTLQKMHEHASKSPEDYYCYIHTKGVSKPDSRVWLDSEWRRYMMWGVVEQWQECVEGLNAGNDVAGVEWYNDLMPCRTGGIKGNCHGFFAGNFFMACGKHLKTLPNINTIDLANRWNAEAWIGLGAKPKVYEVMNVHSVERTGMFPRGFCRDSYIHKDNIIYVDVKSHISSSNMANKKIHDMTGNDCIVFINGIRQKFMMYPNFFQVTSAPKNYKRKIII